MGDTLKVAITGTGFGVRTQLPGFRLAGGWHVVSLTGRDPDRTAALAAEHDVPQSFTDVTKAAKSGDPDVLSITTPPHRHLPEASAALTAGRSCLLEKPMALDANEAATLTAAAASVPFAGIDHELRALPNVRALRTRLAAGDIGRPLVTRVTFTSHGRARPGTRWNWWSRTVEGGGILGAIGSHVLDLLDFWLGPVAAVGARLTTSIPELPDGDGVLRPVESDDGADLWLTFASGVTGTVSLTTMADRYRGFHWEIHGTEGSLWIDPAGELFAARRGADPARLSEPDPLGPDPVLDGSLWARGFVHAARDLRDHLLGKTPAPHLATFADGWRTQRVLDTARCAAEAAAVLEVPGA